jgi:GGDEF domain-containing protein
VWKPGRGYRPASGAPSVTGGHTIQVTISIDVAVYPEGDGDRDTLTKHDDVVMYAAKKAGYDKHQCYVPALDRLLPSTNEEAHHGSSTRKGI